MKHLLVLLTPIWFLGAAWRTVPDFCNCSVEMSYDDEENKIIWRCAADCGSDPCVTVPWGVESDGRFYWVCSCESTTTDECLCISLVSEDEGVLTFKCSGSCNNPAYKCILKGAAHSGVWEQPCDCGVPVVPPGQ